MQWLLLTIGLSLAWVRQVQSLLLTAAHTSELLGNWYMIFWAGNMPIPRKRRQSPLPPFSFLINDNGHLEFRMHIRKPSGCKLFKLSFMEPASSGEYQTWWRHTIKIWISEDKDLGIAYYEDDKQQKMMGLFGRTLDENPEALRVFGKFVEIKKINKTDIVRPPQADACVLDSQS